MKTALRLLGYAWASPYTLLGIATGLAIILFGGSGRWRQGALEFGDGALGRCAARLFPFSAMTLGHVVVGTDHAMLANVRAHEQVHVRQYERWGPFFVPAYLLSSLVQWLKGGRPYRDNHFERQAFARTRE